MPLTAEMRSVDDQVDWLDNDRVMYHLTGSGADIWVLRTTTPKHREYCASTWLAPLRDAQQATVDGERQTCWAGPGGEHVNVMRRGHGARS